mmetsp:Transcript_1639/g.3569  ORF Transcript_1639/g.3569 Transcript_1639/m.3569 type:complete len:239 (+) Transcript_1639:318-1034(+)
MINGRVGSQFNHRIHACCLVRIVHHTQVEARWMRNTLEKDGGNRTQDSPEALGPFVTGILQRRGKVLFPTALKTHQSQDRKDGFLQVGPIAPIGVPDFFQPVQRSDNPSQSQRESRAHGRQNRRGNRGRQNRRRQRPPPRIDPQYPQEIVLVRRLHGPDLARVASPDPTAQQQCRQEGPDLQHKQFRQSNRVERRLCGRDGLVHHRADLEANAHHLDGGCFLSREQLDEGSNLDIDQV